MFDLNLRIIIYYFGRVETRRGAGVIWAVRRVLGAFYGIFGVFLGRLLAFVGLFLG